jgi:hypothetical protein
LPNEDKTGGETERPRANIPPDEADTVQRLVKTEVAGLLAAHRAEIDLEYRIKRYRELCERHRALRSEAADVKRQMQELNLPPLLLSRMKTE